MPLSLQDQLIQHIPDLRRFARSLERNRSAADDLVQETCERAIRKLSLYQPTGPFLGWLNTMMRNIFVDRVRRRPGVESLDDAGIAEPVQPECQSEHFFLQEIECALAKLPVEQQQVLQVVAIQGQSYEQAATTLDVPLGTIQSRLFRARQVLLRVLDPESGAPWTPQVDNLAKAKPKDEKPN
jgi:RNA polymerase sigma-70 factor (ECF subfamily)